MKPSVPFIIYCLLLFCTGCSNKEHSQELNMIDSLIKELKQLSQNSRNIQLDSMKEAQIHINKQCSILDTFGYDPVQNTEQKKTIDGYRFLKNALKNNRKTYQEIQSEIAFSENQLTDLKTDIKNNQLSSEEFDQYFSDESNALEELAKKISVNQKNIRHYLEVYKLLHHKIVSITDSLLQSNQNPLKDSGS